MEGFGPQSEKTFRTAVLGTRQDEGVGRRVTHLASLRQILEEGPRCVSRELDESATIVQRAVENGEGIGWRESVCRR